jgi:hypothetical protein
MLTIPLLAALTILVGHCIPVECRLTTVGRDHGNDGSSPTRLNEIKVCFIMALFSPVLDLVRPGIISQIVFSLDPSGPSRAQFVPFSAPLHVHS